MVQRGTHPNSLANLKSWTKATRPVPTPTGPIVTPALRRLAALLPPEFMRQSRDKMTMGENVAWVLLWLGTQPEAPGSERARTEVLNRLDGMLKPDVVINAEAGSQVAVGLVWSDGEQA